MQMTDALSDYGRFVLASQPTTKGIAKGSKRSAPGKDAPLPSAEVQDDEPKMPKILKRTLSFTGPALLCADEQQEYSFPFYVAKDQQQFIEDWTNQQL